MEASRAAWRTCRCRSVIGRRPDILSYAALPHSVGFALASGLESLCIHAEYEKYLGSGKWIR